MTGITGGSARRPRFANRGRRLLGRGDWFADGHVLACAYPRYRPALVGLARQGISTVINLHRQPHDPTRLARYGLVEIHLPVPDFTPPAPEQIEHGVAAIESAVALGQRGAVHCGAGLGRTGTLIACYLVQSGVTAEAAIARVRAIRPGSIETADQAAAVYRHAARHRDRGPAEAASS